MAEPEIAVPGPGVDIELIEPPFGRDVARGYLIMSGKASEFMMGKGDNMHRQLMLRVIDPVSTAMLAMYQSDKVQLFSSVFHELSERHDRAPSTPVEEVVTQQGSKPYSSQQKWSQSLLKRFARTVVDTYSYTGGNEPIET